MILDINGKIKVIDESKLKYKTREEYDVFAPLFYIMSWEQYLTEFGE